MPTELHTEPQLKQKEITETPIEHNVKLTSSEIANLWNQYMNDSLAICLTSHSLEKVQDKEVRGILEHVLELSNSHIEKVTEFFNQAKLPIPKGFTNKEDVNLEAPPLFSDIFMLNYFYVMSIIGLTGYSGALGTSARADQRDYFIQCNTETMGLFNKIVDVMLQKGIFFRSPTINAPNKIDFVNNQNYLTGWFGKRRPMNAIELSGVYYNMLKLDVKIVLEIGFSQVVQSAEVRKFLQRGAELCQEQFQALGSSLSDDNLPTPKSWLSEISNSTVSPFSDKLILFQAVTLISASAAFYGAGLSGTQRRDLAVQYAKFIAEMGLYAEDGMELLISKGWMEQPPGADDRESLANKK